MKHSEPGSAAESTSIFAGGLIGDDQTRQHSDAAGHGRSAPVEAPADAVPADGALLVVKRGPNVGSHFTLEADSVSAGRHPDSDIFLDDVSVSRRHAQFHRVAGGFEVVDVGSLNGTYVNGEVVESAELSHGDEIQIGKFRLVYFSAPAAASADTGSTGTADGPRGTADIR